MYSSKTGTGKLRFSFLYRYVLAQVTSPHSPLDESFFKQSAPLAKKTTESIPPRVLSYCDITASLIHIAHFLIPHINVNERVLISPQTRGAFALLEHGARHTFAACVATYRDIGDVRHTRLQRGERLGQ